MAMWWALLGIMDEREVVRAVKFYLCAEQSSDRSAIRWTDGDEREV
jgi:hypothetical protein